MNKGRVKWYSEVKGYGFIVDDQSREIFMHHSNIEGDRFKQLNENQEVRFDLYEKDGKYNARNVRKL